MCFLCNTIKGNFIAAAIPAPVEDAGHCDSAQAFLSEARVSEGNGVTADISTAAAMAVGDTFDGTLSSLGEVDWIAIDLEAGQDYVFALWGRDGGLDGLLDPVLQLFDSAGNAVPGAMNDDVVPGANGNRFSQVETAVADSGTYYLGVSGNYEGTATTDAHGNYTLMAATDVFTARQVSDYIVNFAWGFPVPLAFGVGPGDTLTANIGALNADGQQLARWALESWGVATGIKFAFTSSASANLMFDDSKAGAFGGPVNANGATGINAQSIVNVGTEWLVKNGTTIDSYSFQTYMHEIGHALGLGHSGPYGGGTSTVYGTHNVFDNDSTQMTVMSYFDLSDNKSLAGADYTVITPMLADIVAMGDLYGKADVHPGDTVWGAGSNVGGWMGQVFGVLFDGAAAPSGLLSGGSKGITLTIHDTGGTDTLDLGADGVAGRIDLTPGAASDIGGMVGNLVISLDTVIENVIGSGGDDRLTGNGADNRLTGGAGNDTLDGGGGTDTAIYDVTSGDLTVTLNPDGSYFVASDDGTDRLRRIETVTLRDGTFTIADILAGDPEPIPVKDDDPVETPDPSDLPVIPKLLWAVTRPEPTALAEPVPGAQPDGAPDPAGSAAGDLLIGAEGVDKYNAGAGDDTVFGGGGNDEIRGGDGNDEIHGGDGDDRLPAQDGDDTIFGGDGDDRIGGSHGDDIMVGGNGDDIGGGGHGDDMIFGGLGDDWFSGGAHQDRLEGGAGNDRLAGSYGHDTVIGGTGDDTMGGGTGSDLMAGGDGHDQIGAGDHDDTVYGGSGDDFLGGGSGADQLFGGSGDDTLAGGYGDDYMEGGSGADVFVFNVFGGDGQNVIADFEAGTDFLRLVGRGLPAADPLGALDMTDVSYDGAASTTLSYGAFDILLAGVSVQELDLGDFLFT